MLRQKPRRLQYATGILSRAAFRIHGIQNHISGRDGWIRTSECRRQRPMPYRLATPPYSFARNSVTLKITRCVRSASQGYMGWVKGLEPSTLGTTIRCSNQLSYTHHIHVMTAKQYLLSEPNGRDGWIRTSECRRQRPMPYRLATPPYSFARNSVTLKITRCVRSASQGYMGWVKGLEPSTLGTTIRCSNQLSYTHHIQI